jgi:enoyl-CoA hydratase/carnithine racemase
VAVLRGDVSGFGLDVALACDFRVATDETSLTWSGVGAGGVPSGAAARELVGLVGYARALEWSVLGSTLPAARAAELGLLTTVVAGSAVDRAAESVVEALLAVPRDRAVETKAVLLQGRRRLDPPNRTR